MEAPRTRSASIRRTALQVGAAAAAAAIVVGAITLGGDDDGDEVATVEGPPGNDFTLARADGWREVPDDEREELPGNPLLVMRRGQGQGLLIVNAPSGSERNLDRVSRSLDRRLRKAIPDFRKASARVVEVEAGQALLYSYARGRRATAHTILVVPTDDRTYTINAVVPAGADDAAREVGAMLFSFDI
jgi:hypothetical protein